MKKMIAIGVLLASTTLLSIGCSTNSSFLPCRSGSLWPTSRTSTSQVYMTSGTGSQCDPCGQAGCAPCEPACNPCVPAACDPCAASCLPTGTILPTVTN